MIFVARSLQVLPASQLPCLVCLTEIVMRHTRHSSRAARRWHILVGVRWQRWQSRVAALYYRRVTLPVQLWVACGQPSQFRPQLPWWQPFVFSYLGITGWARR
jgi:hypothetical protein